MQICCKSPKLSSTHTDSLALGGATDVLHVAVHLLWSYLVLFSFFSLIPLKYQVYNNKCVDKIMDFTANASFCKMSIDLTLLTSNACCCSCCCFSPLLRHERGKSLHTTLGLLKKYRKKNEKRKKNWSAVNTKCRGTLCCSLSAWI